MTYVDLREPPEVWLDCPECGGEGGWEQHCRTYEPGCGFAHDDSEWRECHVCHGIGGMICEAEEDNGRYHYDPREDEA